VPPLVLSWVKTRWYQEPLLIVPRTLKDGPKLTAFLFQFKSHGLPLYDVIYNSAPLATGCTKSLAAVYPPPQVPDIVSELNQISNVKSLAPVKRASDTFKYWSIPL
jgi:hypothetical protein